MIWVIYLQLFYALPFYSDSVAFRACKLVGRSIFDFPCSFHNMSKNVVIFWYYFYRFLGYQGNEHKNTNSFTLLFYTIRK